MTPETIAAVGRCLHGRDWQSALARDLGRSPRSARRWATDGIPAELDEIYVPKLIALLEAKNTELLATYTYLCELP